MTMPLERIECAALLKNQSLLVETAKRIAEGAVFVYPTETVYGIGGRCDKPEIFQRICAIKGRDLSRQMILLGATVDSFSILSPQFSLNAAKCAEAFWPGPLTIIIPTSDKPDGTAIRVTDHPFIHSLSSVFTIPLFSTSANISGKPYQADPDTIAKTFGKQVDFMIDDGNLTVSPPSTIIRFSPEDELVIVREGCIEEEKLREIVR